MKNKKGFTLIELLAVIIILGILMIIAIPSVTQYINNSRKSAYIDTAKEIIAGARNRVNQGDLEMFSTDTTYYIPASCVGTENGQKSPYGDFDQAYVLVTYNGHGYKYYWVSRDVTGQGVKDPVEASTLTEDNIESDIAFDYIKPTVTKDGTTKIKVIDQTDCNSFEPPKLCVRALSLHETECLSNYYCTSLYSAGDVISYGNNPATRVSGTLMPGDAFDCDVNADGTYDYLTERFYYVNTEGEVASLIYYSNVRNGVPLSDLGVQYDNIGLNYYGPETAFNELPSKTQWSNSKIIDLGERNITNENGGNTTTNGSNIIQSFTYTGKAARFLTIQELKSACGLSSITRYQSGDLDNCLFLSENTAFDSNYYTISYGFWLENPIADFNNDAWAIHAGNRSFDDVYVSSNTRGVRPVIDVNLSDIEY